MTIISRAIAVLEAMRSADLMLSYCETGIDALALIEELRHYGDQAQVAYMDAKFWESKTVGLAAENMILTAAKDAAEARLLAVQALVTQWRQVSGHMTPIYADCANRLSLLLAATQEAL